MFESEYRDLAFVPRWGIARTHQNQSVAEHSYYVALYTSQICDFMLNHISNVENPRGFDQWREHAPLCVAYALNHDRSEAYLSDIPGPVKRNIVDKPKMQEYEEIMDMQIFGDPIYQGKLIPDVVKVADLMDEYAFWMVESGLGNTFCGQILPKIGERLHEAVRRLPFVKEEVAVALLQAFFDGITKPKTIPENNQDVAS